MEETMRVAMMTALVLSAGVATAQERPTVQAGEILLYPETQPGEFDRARCEVLGTGGGPIFGLDQAGVTALNVPGGQNVATPTCELLGHESAVWGCLPPGQEAGGFRCFLKCQPREEPLPEPVCETPLPEAVYVGDTISFDPLVEASRWADDFGYWTFFVNVDPVGRFRLDSITLQMWSWGPSLRDDFFIWVAVDGQHISLFHRGDAFVEIPLGWEGIWSEDGDLEVGIYISAFEDSPLGWLDFRVAGIDAVNEDGEALRFAAQPGWGDWPPTPLQVVAP